MGFLLSCLVIIFRLQVTQICLSWDRGTLHKAEGFINASRFPGDNDLSHVGSTPSPRQILQTCAVQSGHCWPLAVFELSKN